MTTNLKLNDSDYSEFFISTLKALIELIEVIFPEKVLSYYLLGSYADKYQVENSDIDIEIILKNKPADDEADKIDKVLESVYHLSNSNLDIGFISLETLKSKNSRVSLVLKSNSVLIYGEEIKDRLYVPSQQEYLDFCLSGAFEFITRIRNKDKILRFPLDYPERDDMYYGYMVREIKINNEIKVSNKELLVNSGWITTALIALKTGEFVYSKDQYLKIYENSINDEWSNLIRSIYTNCREKWHYLIPEDDNEKSILINLCKKELDYENYFLSLYKSYLIEQINSDKPDLITKALKVLEKIDYQDQVIITLLKKLLDNQMFKQKASEILVSYNQI